METKHATNALLNLTESGNPTTWVDRMAAHFKNCGGDCSVIDWRGSPQQVAARIIEMSIKGAVIPLSKIIVITECKTLHVRSYNGLHAKVLLLCCNTILNGSHLSLRGNGVSATKLFFECKVCFRRYTISDTVDSPTAEDLNRIDETE